MTPYYTLSFSDGICRYSNYNGRLCRTLEEAIADATASCLATDRSCNILDDSLRIVHTIPHLSLCPGPCR